MSLQYDDFDLQITPLPGGRYRVHLNGPSGQASGEFVLPFTDMDFGNFLGRIGQVRRSTRRSDGPELNAAKDFGGKLFNAVFSGEMIAQLRSSVEQTQERDRGLRIRLRLTDAPELGDLPWEFLYDSAHNHFLTTSNQTPVVRFLDLPQRVTPLKAALPLRVLVVIASPRNLKRLDTEGEWLRLQDALGDLLRTGQIVLERLPTANLNALRLRARGTPFHIFHFIGHGGFDHQAEDGVLQFEDVDNEGNPTGMSCPVRGETLGVLLHDHRSLRLAVLNACEGARGSRRDPFSGVAQSLLQQRVPAVIAMQFEISDLAAKVFAREFYCAIAEGNPVDAAVCESRKALFNEEFGQEWATPVLYMRSQEGTLFDLVAAGTTGTAVPEPPRTQTGEHILAEAARKAAELAEATRSREAAARAAETAAAEAAAERERAEKERAETARIENAKADEARRRVKAEQAAVVEREKKETERRAEAVAREQAATSREQAASDREVVAHARTDERKAFPVWQVGAGAVILALLFALSWHHLRPHSHSDEDNGAGAANSSQAATPQSQSVAPASQTDSSAHRDSDSSTPSGASPAKHKGSARDSKNKDAANGGAAPSENARASGASAASGNAAANTTSGTSNAAAPSSPSGNSSNPGSNTSSNAGSSSATVATSAATTAPLRVSPSMQEAQLIKRVSPDYPAQAIRNNISGMIVLDVVIAKDGTVKSAKVVSGDPILANSAIEAVNQRVYAATMVNGSAVEVETTVSMDFAIKNAATSGGTSGGTSPSLPPSSLPANTNSLPNTATAPCTLGNVAFQENGSMIVGTVPFTYSGSAKLPTLAVVGFPVGADKKRIAGVKLAETTLQSASGNASFSMQSNPSLSGGGATGEYVEVVVIVKATGEAVCGKLVPYLRNW